MKSRSGSRRAAFCAALCVMLPLFGQTKAPAPQLPATKSAAAKASAPLSSAKPVQAQSASTINYGAAAGGAQFIEINNVSYEVTNSGVAGRPHDERLMLRKTIHSKETIGDIDVDATVTLEAWPLGTDAAQKPLYRISESGTDGRTIDADLFVVDRRLEEVAWWSAHKLGSGEHLFDTYVPLVAFSISRETVTTRYAGLDVPPDDVKDKRLNEAHVVAVLSYASAEKIIREVMITCDDPQQAKLLRSYADTSRTLSDVEILTNPGRNQNPMPRHSLELTISRNYPSPPNTVEIRIPIVGDELDLANAMLPPKLHVAAWKR